MKTASKQEMVACPKCEAEFAIADAQLKSILTGKDKEIADLSKNLWRVTEEHSRLIIQVAGYQKRIEELEAINESHRKLNEWVVNQQIRKLRKRKANKEGGF